MVRQLIGSAVQLTVTQFLVLENHCGRFWRSAYLLLEELMNTSMPRVFRVSIVPFNKQALPLRGG
jgi:hypothetical protein